MVIDFDLKLKLEWEINNGLANDGTETKTSLFDEKRLLIALGLDVAVDSISKFRFKARRPQQNIDAISTTRCLAAQ